jgi:hypothetical protein
MAITFGIIALVVICSVIASSGHGRSRNRVRSDGMHWPWFGGSDSGGGFDGGGGGGDGGGG